MLKPYFRFYWLALKEYLPERRRKLLKAAYLALIFIAGWIIGHFLGIPLIRPLKWTYSLMPGSYWAIVGLLALAVFQGLAMEGARRYHERTVADLKAEDDLRGRRIKELSEVHGSAYVLVRQFSADSERPTAGVLKHWAECLGKALYACYGLSGADKFSRGGHYIVTPPEAESDQSNWLWENYQRLEDLIKEECPEPEKFLPRNIPDAAYRS